MQPPAPTIPMTYHHHKKGVIPFHLTVRRSNPCVRRQLGCKRWRVRASWLEQQVIVQVIALSPTGR
jgi:hypothetical protein